VAAEGCAAESAPPLIQDRLIRQWSGWCGAVFEVEGSAGAVGVEGGCEAAGQTWDEDRVGAGEVAEVVGPQLVGLETDAKDEATRRSVRSTLTMAASWSAARVPPAR